MNIQYIVQIMNLQFYNMENLHIVNLSQYNKPQIKEDKRKNWVAYGDDNNYYQYLIDLYKNR